MKTTFYIAFGLTNTSTRNFLLGTFSIDDENLLKTFKEEQLTIPTQPTLARYIINHPETYATVPSFAETLQYFSEDMFMASLLGSYIEKSDAERRVQLSLESFKRNKRNTLYVNDCYNLNPHIDNEMREQKEIKELSSKLQDQYKKEQKEIEKETKKKIISATTRETNGVNNKSEVKKQSITIVENETGEEHNFETKGDCMHWLKCATDTFARFLKGQTKLNKKYRVKEELLTESSLT